MGRARTLTRNQLPAALVVASTLHATHRHLEAERVLARIMRVCPGAGICRSALCFAPHAIPHPRHRDATFHSSSFSRDTNLVQRDVRCR